MDTVIEDRQNYFVKRWIKRVLARRRVIWQHVYNGTPCMKWQGNINAVNGYGQVRVSPHFKALGNVKVTGAHRAMYAIERGPIPYGYHIDHDCENRWCVNSQHLTAMPQCDNSRLANLKRWHGDRIGPQPEEPETWGESYADYTGNPSQPDDPF